MGNSWPWTPTTKPHFQMRNETYSQNVFLLLLESMNNWFCHTWKHSLCFQVTGCLESQLEHSWPFGEATATTSRLPHGMSLKCWLQICVCGLTLKEVTINVLLKGDLIQVRFGGKRPSRGTCEVQIYHDFKGRLHFLATS